MTESQLGALTEIHGSAREIIEVSYSSMNGNLFVSFIDGGGNYYKRSYNKQGAFRELDGG